MLTSTAIAVAFAASTAAASTGAPVAVATNGHATIKGVDYYYEVRGRGEPLLMLHGGLGNIGMFDPVMPSYAQGREVIAVDLQGHDLTHYEIFASPRLAETVLPFLNGQAGAKSWADQSKAPETVGPGRR